MLYCLNDGSDIGSKYEEETTAEPSRMPNFARKIRSKSEDATYVPEEMEGLDDDFFQRYDWFQLIIICQPKKKEFDNHNLLEILYVFSL